MATQLTKISPLDLNKNIVIGVSLPFNAAGVFNKTYSTKEQIKSNLINLLLTAPGERVMNPIFGAGLKKIIFEAITQNNEEIIREVVVNSITRFIPEVQLIDVIVTAEEDQNIVTIEVQYAIKLSGTQDQIQVQFV